MIRHHVLTGSAVGTLKITDGALCLHDDRCDVCLWLVSPDRHVVERVSTVVGQRIQLTFEVTQQISEGYVVPLQIQRCPEEYRRPTFQGQFTSVSLLHSGDFDQPHLLGDFSCGFDEDARLNRLLLSPEDFSYLFGQKLIQAAVDKPMLDAVVANSKGKVVDTKTLFPRVITGNILIHQECFELIDLESVKTWDEWAASMVENHKLVTLPGLKEDNNDLHPSEDRRRRRSVSSRIRYEIFRRDGHRCVDCGASAQDDPFVRLEIDHRIPVSKGGSNDPQNLQTLCWACNNGKSDRVDHKLGKESAYEEMSEALCS
jgi:hypothetical protein